MTNFFLYEIIYIQYIIILCICASIFLLKLGIDYQKKRTDGKISGLKTLLKEVIVGKRAWNETEWAQKKESISIILRALETFDVLVESEAWSRIKNILCEKWLLPWARLNATAFIWSKRNKSVRIFLLYPTLRDVPIMESLLNDPSFFIRMGAVAALAKIASPETIVLLLTHMAAEKPPARFPYRHALLNMPLKSLVYLMGIYQESDENIRLACLDIMSRRFISNPINMIKGDYQSPNSLIRIFIVKILGNLASEEAATDLVLFLKDSDSKVRAEAVLSLGKLIAEKTFEKVTEMLHDEDYEVRLQAAIALTKFGRKGIHALETQDWDIDPQAFQIARYVLTMP